MSLWEALNSPFALTAFGLLWSSLAATWITAMWQRRAHHHAVKLTCAQDLISVYHSYIRLLKGDPERLEGEEYDHVHARMLSLAKIAGLLFEDDDVKQAWDKVASEFAAIRQFRVEGKHQRSEQRLVKIYKQAAVATEHMFRELRK